MATRKRTAAEAGPTATFEVISNLSLDNEDYVPGDTVELTEEQAIELGPQVVKPVAAKAAKPE
ncbi:hypothetical protein [Variovorax atrisoli]|uniref:hypothetical protein n=1 Tax=Variovorax atrisoli TaxID=3394203 RepID=UPI0033911BFF